jgi:hypothetical protein
MLGIDQLKPFVRNIAEEVECPVRGCSRVVPRQRKTFRRDDRFKCPDHEIFISGSTFEYASEVENLLWRDEADLCLLSRIKGVKRESRIARDNSEDALTWNVFRFLEKNKLVDRVLSPLVDRRLLAPKVIYWSYSQRDLAAWPGLDRTRTEFGENLQRSSEPDLIVDAADTLVFVEAKLTAGNETAPSRSGSQRGYEDGGRGWFSRAFKSDYESVAIKAKKYELMRFWLLGTWLANEMGKQFCLINVVRESEETDIENAFGHHIRQIGGSRFIRVSWECIYRQIADIGQAASSEAAILTYLANKSLGYNNQGRLRKAFDVAVRAGG